MGIVVVLIFYAIGMTVAATLGAIVLGLLAHVLTKQSGQKRKMAVRASVLFPFVCVAFAGVWFVTYATANNIFFHRDPGLGDTWETPLPNGYALMMIDTTDQGTVYNPKTQRGDGSVSGQEDAIFGVRQLQIANGLIFGARDSGFLRRIGQESQTVDIYFELDTVKKYHVEFKSLAELRQRAAGESVALKLREFRSVFSDYRTTWFDYAAEVILLVTPVAGFFYLARWVWKIRQTRIPSGP